MIEVKKNRLNKVFVFLATLFITLVILWLLFKSISLDFLFSVFSQLKWHVILIPFILYLIGNILRSLRTYILFEKSISYYKIFNITCIHNFLNNVLPWRMGEFSHIFLLKNEGIEGTKGLFTLGILRIFDMVIILLFFSVSLLFAPKSNIFFNYFALFFCFLLLLIIYFLIFKPIFILNFMKRIRGKPSLLFLRKIMEKIIETLQHFNMIKSKQLLFQMFIISLLLWSFLLLADFIVVSYFIQISISVFVLGSCLAMLTYLLPIQGFMGFGTTEGTWVLVLLFFGFAKEQSIVSGLAFHVFGLMYAFLLGVYGFFKIKKG